jgi:predicted metalloprotease with PDZ domain
MTNVVLFYVAFLGCHVVRPARTCGSEHNDQSARPSVDYTLRIDSTHLDVAEVTVALRGMPDRFHLAMKVHAEYDAKYWRYVSDVRTDSGGSVTRTNTALWDVILPRGRGIVRYRVHFQPPSDTPRRVWLPTARADGAFINPPDFFLYSPEAPDASGTVTLDVPRSWRVATALSRVAPMRYEALGAVMLLDTPIMLGALHAWSFGDRGVSYHVVYWPAPSSTPFDTTVFVDALHRLAASARDVFGAAPTRDYWFLVQDGAGDALEHSTSVVIGVQSANLGANPRGSLPEIAHEFFHTWNLVAVRPASYNDLSYGAPARTPSLWVGEGLTLYYADALLRRTGLADTSVSRLEHLARLYTRYLGSPAIRSTAPEQASLAFGDRPVENPQATGGYYLQGELLGNVIDALVRDSTRDSRGLDDVMRMLYRQSRRDPTRGYTPDDVRAAVDSTCFCRSAALFESQVRRPGLIDVAPVVQRLGLRALIDTIQATDAAGNASPDLRVGFEFPEGGGPARLVVSNPSSAWFAAGLRTGDTLVFLNGESPGSFSEAQRALAMLRAGNEVRVVVRGGGGVRESVVRVAPFKQPRVRFVDQATVTDTQRGRRAEWLRGR